MHTVSGMPRLIQTAPRGSVLGQALSEGGPGQDGRKSGSVARTGSPSNGPDFAMQNSDLDEHRRLRHLAP